MTTKPKAKKFRIRRDAPLGQSPQEKPQAAALPPPPAARSGQVESAKSASAETALDAIRREGLTGRQLRMARRVAQKQGIAATSDFDAVLQLRQVGVDPFQRNTILELVAPDGKTDAAQAAPQAGAPTKELGRIQLPQTVPQDGANLPSTERANPAADRSRDIFKIQRDIAKRRRRKLALLLTRLSFFVFIPTIIVGYYFMFMATPMFATNSEFVIQQADSTGSSAGGLGGMFQGTGMATQQDSITVQSYLASRAALVRLDEDHGFRAHFSAPEIDSVQRLTPDATNEALFELYQKRVKISYDPTEGILRMEVIAATPEASQEFSESLIEYAEEQVDQLTRRLREDQMAGALASYQSAETRRSEALAEWLKIQESTDIIDPAATTGAIISQVSALESQRQQLQLSLAGKLSVSRPNQAQFDGLRAQITNLDTLINDLRSQMTSTSDGGNSIASDNTRLRLAEENYNFQTVLVQQALAQMEATQIEANRQVRYLSMGVEPVAPDEATYPRAFENTMLAFLIFSGIYLMISLTSSILREQVTA
ncbi:MAG: capsule biosynthesis protein [Loktanella sp.]|jgi:capsular polysaccharide transport system permease protein|nr:capsule biosynthesis protein [Loktanella sp.]MDO7623875.1 capsule biosynthesis protein [Loktanella sp.]MDO7627298.1 capsule biosynthesis protein [Loktanella sp.]MDO7684786.1 capsule biosynthesis protein [Loktanella sp.]MDO7707025.1 capsule biosynthesis protein [Loktanella sp.]